VKDQLYLINLNIQFLNFIIQIINLNIHLFDLIIKFFDLIIQINHLKSILKIHFFYINFIIINISNHTKFNFLHFTLIFNQICLNDDLLTIIYFKIQIWIFNFIIYLINNFIKFNFLQFNHIFNLFRDDLFVIIINFQI